jgi:hypothetical protein
MLTYDILLACMQQSARLGEVLQEVIKLVSRRVCSI